MTEYTLRCGQTGETQTVVACAKRVGRVRKPHEWNDEARAKSIAAARKRGDIFTQTELLD